MIKLLESEFKAIGPYTVGGWKINEPIKLLRARTYCGLREGEDSVDFAIKRFIEVGLTWLDYDTNFEYWKDVIPAQVVKGSDGHFYTSCPCSCGNRFMIEIPAEEILTVPVIDDDAELSDEELERAKRQQEGISIGQHTFYCPTHEVMYIRKEGLENHLKCVAHTQEELDLI